MLHFIWVFTVCQTICLGVSSIQMVVNRNYIYLVIPYCVYLTFAVLNIFTSYMPPPILILLTGRILLVM